MDMEERIKKIKAGHLKKIEEAARAGDTPTILHSSSVLNELEQLQEKYSDAKNSLIALEEERMLPAINRKENVPIRNKNENTSDGEMMVSFKAMGKMRRTDFLEEARKKGINLTKGRGVRYIKGNRLVGIASASERIANRWFLGLPPDRYDAVILLCETINKSCLQFIIGRDLYKNINGQLTKDDNGQIKFNISKQYQHYFLKIPGREEININQCVDNFESLKML